MAKVLLSDLYGLFCGYTIIRVSFLSHVNIDWVFRQLRRALSELMAQLHVVISISINTIELRNKFSSWFWYCIVAGLYRKCVTRQIVVDIQGAYIKSFRSLPRRDTSWKTVLSEKQHQAASVAKNHVIRNKSASLHIRSASKEELSSSSLRSPLSKIIEVVILDLRRILVALSIIRELGDLELLNGSICGKSVWLGYPDGEVGLHARWQRL